MTARNFQSIRANYWDSARTRSQPLTADEMYIELYLITCPQCGPSGAFITSPATIAYYTGLSQDEGESQSDLFGRGKVEGILDALEQKGRIKNYHGGWIWICGKWEFESQNPNVQKALFVELESVPGRLVKDFLGMYQDTLTLGVPDRVSGRVSDKVHNSLSDSTTDRPALTKLDYIITKQSKINTLSPKKGDQVSDKNERTIISDAYQDCYIKQFDKKPLWGNVEGKRITELLKRFEGDAERIAQAIKKAFKSEDVYMKEIVGSFMVLTAAANIAKADTLNAETVSMTPEQHRKYMADKHGVK